MVSYVGDVPMPRRSPGSLGISNTYAKYLVVDMSVDSDAEHLT
jgi:hypothetical protein